MAVTRERLMQGMSFDEYIAQMTKNQERFDQTYQNLNIDPQAIEQIKILPQSLDVLVIAEDWCGDVINNLPILGKLAKESGKLNLHVFLRDQHEDLINQYLKEGKFKSIPVFVFFDEQMRELGRFIERPDAVTQLNEESRQQVLAQHPKYNKSVDELSEADRAEFQRVLTEARAKNLPKAQKIVVQNLCALVSGRAA